MGLWQNGMDGQNDRWWKDGRMEESRRDEEGQRGMDEQ